jgi:hypothetical protein
MRSSLLQPAGTGIGYLALSSGLSNHQQAPYTREATPVSCHAIELLRVGYPPHETTEAGDAKGELRAPTHKAVLSPVQGPGPRRHQSSSTRQGGAQGVKACTPMELCGCIPDRWVPVDYRRHPTAVQVRDKAESMGHRYSKATLVEGNGRWGQSEVRKKCSTRCQPPAASSPAVFNVPEIFGFGPSSSSWTERLQRVPKLVTSEETVGWTTLGPS